jgi:hypothetical protein
VSGFSGFMKRAWATTRRTWRWIVTHPPGSWAVGAYHRLRSSHHARVLRWLRNGMMLAVAATLLLCLGVAVVAHHRINNARQTKQAITDIHNASVAAQNASTALDIAFAVADGDPTLTGTGFDFDTYKAQVEEYLTAAAAEGGAAAGPSGEEQFQFVQGQLSACDDLAETAVGEFGALGALAAQSASSCLTQQDQKVGRSAVVGTGGLTAELDDLGALEANALNAQRGSFWLDPAAYLWLLLAPSFAMLILLAATAVLLARYFRRLVSPLLPAALLLSVVVAIVVDAFSASDDGNLLSNPWAGNPAATLTVSLVLLAALLSALVLAYLGYYRRLDEYRFRAS